MTTQHFRLPDVGEGLTEADVLTWHVGVGDEVEVNQTIVDIETAKSVVELPSPWAGSVTEVLVAAGETVAVGTPIIAIRASDASDDVDEPGPVQDEPALLVGYGAREPSRRRRDRSRAVDPAPEPAQERASAARVRAKPPVRRLAKQLEVDLSAVSGSGPDGVVTREDVTAAASARAEDRAVLDQDEGDGAVTRVPIAGVRKHMAAAMVSSAFTAPHVTELVTIDVTPTLELRSRLSARRELAGVKLSPLVFVARAYLRALARTPLGNGRWDEDAQEIVVPGQVNLGIAAATPRGLVVPHVAAADRLGLVELANAISSLAETARAGRTPTADMIGGTTTITNVGVFGIDTGTPILNPGESTILAVGAVRRAPWVVGEGADERLEIRSVLQLALSFDHRVLDGQQGSQILSDTAAHLSDPALAVL